MCRRFAPLVLFAVHAVAAQQVNVTAAAHTRVEVDAWNKAYSGTAAVPALTLLPYVSHERAESGHGLV